MVAPCSRTPTMQLHDIAVVASASGHTEKKKIKYSESVIHKQESTRCPRPSHQRFSARRSSPLMRPAGTSPWFAVRANNVYLVSEKSANSVPSCRHARVYGPRDYGHAWYAYPPSPLQPCLPPHSAQNQIPKKHWPKKSGTHSTPRCPLPPSPPPPPVYLSTRVYLRYTKYRIIP